MRFLAEKRVLILGLGESGMACARFAHAHGAQVRVADTRSSSQSPPPQLAQLRQEVPSAEVVLGELNPSLLDGVDRIAISPGLAPESTGVKPLLEEAARKDIPVDSEIEWFALALNELAEQSGYHPKLVAITGTNGKTTVTKLSEHLARAAGWDVVACGNVSPAALDSLLHAMRDGKLPQLWVLELSSFQLHFTRSLAADAATVLNLSQDHLDWHGSMAAYTADKARIFSERTVRVLNRDDSAVNAMRSESKAAAQPVTFGLHAPTGDGDWGVVEDGALCWLVQARAADEVPRKKGAAPAETQLHRLMPADALRIRGSHNHANALAALALLSAAGMSLAAMLRGLREYAGEPHRAQLVATINDVDFVDDSKGTNVGATLAAIQGLAQGRKKVVLIAGGQGKGQDFAPLTSVTPLIKAAVLIGADAQKIDLALAGFVNPIAHAASLPDAVRVAASESAPGDIVLLSPACASLDMFQNYKHRADVFVQAVQEHAADMGQA